MQAEINRALSLVAALACLVVSYFYGSSEIFHLGIVTVVLPLGCIWYGNEIGELVVLGANGEGGAGNIIGMLITVAGWVALLFMLAVIVFLAFGYP